MSKVPDTVDADLFANIIVKSSDDSSLQMDDDSTDEPWRQAHDQLYGQQSITENPDKNVIRQIAGNMAKNEPTRMHLFSQGCIGARFHWQEDGKWKKMRFYLLNLH